ncbi:hypothetical protein CASFOL_034964 [Castilleja foliolosa]|uniref:DUF7794 domain-containing protein n=1 Tax=Castilleja foliolosa TaxID=1961234 RepID=A0ABD3BS21_9LAMI
MDPRSVYNLTILFILSLLSIHAKVISGDSTVVFLDSPTHQHLRRPSSSQTGSLSPSEIGATASVLLGFAPHSTLTPASSSKLNEVLAPNPFDRPRALLMLEVPGAEESQLVADSDESPFSGALRVNVEGNERVVIQLGEDEVSLVSLDELSSNSECSDKELSEFASWLGGSYVEDESKQLNGELIIPTTNGAFLRLHLSERADKEFATSLVLLINNIRRAKEIHQVLTKSEISPAELITGRFGGIKALQDHYGKEGIAQSGLEVFVNSVSKAFNLLQSAYQGQIVGVIANGDQLGFQVTVNPRSSARQLEENEISPEMIKIAEVLFVRLVLAWITGIILLLATLLGIYYLLYMPITKDTLLYSNVKLD